MQNVVGRKLLHATVYPAVSFLSKRSCSIRGQSWDLQL